MSHWLHHNGFPVTRRALCFVVLLGAMGLSTAAEVFGTIELVDGSARILDAQGQSRLAHEDDKVSEGETIVTGRDTEVHIRTEDHGFVAVRSETKFRIDSYSARGESGDKSVTSLLVGALRSITGWIGKHNTGAYRITTPNATLGIRGTDHETTVIEKADGDEPGTYDTVNEGETVLKTAHGEVGVGPGKFAFAPKNGAVAPHFLEKHPNFLAKRKLKIEERVQQRKDFFRSRMEKMRNARIGRVKEIQGAKRKQALEQQGRAHEQKPSQFERRSGMRETWLKQNEQRKESIRNEAKRRRENKQDKAAKRPRHKEIV